MDLQLQRQPSANGCTIGELFVDGVHECWTLEDVVRDGHKIAHETAIPPGTYRVIVTMSARFGRILPLVCDVPDFDGIRIHAGNTAADTSGCILVGQSRETVSIDGSRLALEALQPKIAGALARGQAVTIAIVNAGAQPLHT